MLYIGQVGGGAWIVGRGPSLAWAGGMERRVWNGHQLCADPAWGKKRSMLEAARMEPTRQGQVAGGHAFFVFHAETFPCESQNMMSSRASRRSRCPPSVREGAVNRIPGESRQEESPTQESKTL